MELKAIDSKKTFNVSEQAFALEYNEGLVHQAVTAYFAGGRAGTKAQKTRSDVSGGGAKPWRQKGTGRARAGTIRSPLWRKGGVTFAARPRDFSQKINKKMYRVALRSIFSELVRQERLTVLEDVSISAPKTKLLAEKLDGYGLKDVLIIVDEINTDLLLASRNLPFVNVIRIADINPVVLLKHKSVCVTANAVESLEAWLSHESK